MHKIDNLIYDPARLILYSADIDRRIIEDNVPQDDDFLDMKERIDRIDSSSMIDPKYRFPTDGGICLTYKCQLRCEYCSFCSTNESKFQINQDDINKFIKYLIKNIIINKYSSGESKTLKITFSGGGEPTFNWSLFYNTVEFIKAECVKYNIEYRLNLTTNGLITTDQARYITHNFNEAMISFDGLPFLQDQNRKNGNYTSSKNVLNTIEIFDNSEIDYIIRSSVWQKDYHYMKEIANFLYSNFKNFASWSVMPVMPIGRAIENNEKKSLFDYKNDYISYFLEAYDHIRTNYGMGNIDTPFISNNITGIFCGAVFGEGMWLLPDNRLVECLDAINDSPVLGEVIDGRVALKETYYDALFAQYRLKFFECRNCIAYRFCKGGCPIKFVRHNNSDSASWECRTIVSYWEKLFKKLWTSENYLGWHLEGVETPRIKGLQVYKLIKNQ